jgi:alkylation response protein AidB-like acyl-CoA dehydrogenase
MSHRIRSQKSTRPGGQLAGKFVSENNVRFLLYDVFNVLELTTYDYFGQHSRKMFDMVLSEALKLAKNKFYPILEEMDRQGIELKDGRINVHPAIREIMEECGKGGWIGASFPETSGGEQLPLMIYSIIKYYFSAANYSASVYPDLTAGAARLITSFGSQELIETYVPSMLEGRWQGTMALTEPQAGSSLADIATRATLIEDVTYSIKGQKVFITAGDHDGVDNIVHLMLARIDGAPDGVKGISLFVVPQKRFDPVRKLMDNDITVSQIFHKLGYKGAPSTELVIGEKGACQGYLVGEPHKGLKYMFQMMNEFRLGVAISATGIASAAYYASLEYTQERPQGRKTGQKGASLPQVPIIEHADVKRMLLFQRAVTEGSLSLLLQCSKYADLEQLCEGDLKERYALLLDLLTPIAKTYPSEMSIQSTSQAIQCLGGYGYCDDFPVEQYFRDSRIHPIHEGTTGIQGMDLLGRKVVMKKGQALKLFLDEVNTSIETASQIPDLTPYAEQLTPILVQLQDVTAFKVSQRETPEIFLSDASLYLEYFGLIAIAWQWLLQAIAAHNLGIAQQGPKKLFYEGKVATFKYYFAYELPRTQGIATRLLSSDDITVSLTPGLFSD